MSKLLIIEDDLNLALSLKGHFKDKGYEVTIITEGQKGVKLALKSLFDVIILDYGLPDMDGDTISNRLRQNNLDTPIIMLTGRNDSIDIAKSIYKGVDDYLTKPFSIQELEARVFRLITRPPVTRLHNLEGKNLSLDLGNRVLKYKDRVAFLTKREIKLMQYLFLNRNHLVSRDKLLSNVWGDKFELKSNTVDCYIATIRRKLGLRKNTDLLKTSHGFGYILYD